MGISVIRDNIARAVKLFAFQHTPVSVTGVSAETTLFSATIPGGTLGVNGVLEATSLWTVTPSNNGAKTVKTKYGGTPITNLSSGVTMASFHHKGIMRNRNSANSQIIPPPGKDTVYSGTSAVNVTSAIDTSVDQLLVCTAQLTVPTVTVAVSGITRSGQTATATSTAHGYANGRSVLMAGANQVEYNGTFVIFNVTANTFDYTVTGTPATPATGTITAALWDIVTLESVDAEVKKAW